jgi:tRNA threonylcarbamoyladenosine biosynthesis protein TsaE
MHLSGPSTRIVLKNTEQTLALGACVANITKKLGSFPALLLNGQLGAGKTTFVRGLVQALPGCERAEVASPSFNYMNSYPTTPEIFHLDFYRLQHHGLDDELLNALHEPDVLVIVEWAEFCPRRHLPEDHLLLHFIVVPEGRIVTITAHGDAAAHVQNQLLLALEPDMQES